MALSISEIETLSGPDVNTMMRLHLANGTIPNILATTGATKTARQKAFCEGISGADIQNYPTYQDEIHRRKRDGLRPLEGVLHLFINCAPYDEYKFGGMDMPTDVKVSAEEGDEMGLAPWMKGMATLGTTAQPMWFGYIMYWAKQYPNHIIRVTFDEVNLAPLEMQGQMLELFDFKRVGLWAFPSDVAARLAFCCLGNLPSDQASRWRFSGPLANRVWTYSLRVTVDEVLDYLDKQGDSNPYVYHALKQHGDSILFASGVIEGGGEGNASVVPGLNGHMGESSDEDVQGMLTPVINGLSPRAIHQMATALNTAAHLGMDKDSMLLSIHGRAPRQVVAAIRVSVELAETFASMDAILADPVHVKLDDNPLTQAMQLRFMLPALAGIEPDDTPNLIHYVKRMHKGVQSTFAYLVTDMSNARRNDPRWNKVVRTLLDQFAPDFLDQLMGSVDTVAHTKEIDFGEKSAVRQFEL